MALLAEIKLWWRERAIGKALDRVMVRLDTSEPADREFLEAIYHYHGRKLGALLRRKPLSAVFSKAVQEARRA